MLLLLVLTVADTLLEQAVPRGGVAIAPRHCGPAAPSGLWIESPEYVRN